MKRTSTASRKQSLAQHVRAKIDKPRGRAAREEKLIGRIVAQAAALDKPEPILLPLEKCHHLTAAVWADCEGGKVKQGIKFPTFFLSAEKAAQIGMSAVAKIGDIHIWHKPERLINNDRNIEPAALLVMKETNEIVGNYQKYKFVSIHSSTNGKKGLASLLKGFSFA